MGRSDGVVFLCIHVFFLFMYLSALACAADSQRPSIDTHVQECAENGGFYMRRLWKALLVGAQRYSSILK